MPAECCKGFFARIPDDEPVFTIVAHDEFGEEILKSWIKMAIDAGVNEPKIAKGLWHLDEFRKFRREHPEKMKIPD